MLDRLNRVNAGINDLTLRAIAADPVTGCLKSASAAAR